LLGNRSSGAFGRRLDGKRDLTNRTKTRGSLVEDVGLAGGWEGELERKIKEQKRGSFGRTGRGTLLFPMGILRKNGGGNIGD